MTTAAVDRDATPAPGGLPVIKLLPMSEEDQIKEQEKMIKELENPDTRTKFVEACKNIGRTAVAIDNDFLFIKDGLADLVKKYDSDFPKVKSECVPRWDGFRARWEGETGLLWSSRELAAKTAATLTDYSINLQLVAEIASEKDLKEAQAELNDYVEKHPVTIASTVADGFKQLKIDIEKFSKDFSQYLDDEEKKFTKEAEGYEAEIKKFQEEIEILNGKIESAIVALSCTSFFVIGAAISFGFFAAFLDQRKKAKECLDKAKNDLANVRKEQNTLAAMKTDFEVLKPHIFDICSNLGIFASIWAFMTEQSTEISAALNEGIHVITTKKLQIKLDFLRKQVVPLREGMMEYAIQIV